MDMQGEFTIQAPRDAVWKALNDPEILQQCIPGCEAMTPTEEGGLEATVKVAIGPVKATFKGAVRFEDVVEGSSYTIIGEGKGGAAGFAKGSASVTLEDGSDGGTILRYTVQAQVGGKLAQIGSRLIDSTARKYANDFFDRFSKLMQPEAPAMAEPADIMQTAANTDMAAPATEAMAEKPKGLSPIVWVILVLGIAVGVIALSGQWG